MEGFRRAAWISRVQCLIARRLAPGKPIARRWAPLLISLSFLGVSPLAARTDAAGGIDSVEVSKPFFFPSHGQTIEVSLVAKLPGQLTVQILDRDGYLVRTVVRETQITAGRLQYTWDGRDGAGIVVPDEAYSLRILLESKGSRFEYLPGASPAEELKVRANYYDRRTGVISYDLPKAARVHMQAGTVQTDSKRGKATGPVLKTIVNREPRPTGPVIETWLGLDESGSFYVPDLRGFSVSVAATSLPENALISVGNTSETFLERAARRSGDPLIPQPDGGHAHHRGLTALDDVAPQLLVRPVNARQGADQRWTVAGGELQCELLLQGLSADLFARQPGALTVFVGDRPVLTHRAPTSGMTLRIPVGKLPRGEHIVAFDWASEYGPVAAYSFVLDRGSEPTALNRASAEWSGR